MRATSSPFTLVLVEKGENVAETRALVERLGLSDRVEWRAVMSQEEVAEEYRRADVVLDQFADIISQLYLLRLSAVHHLIGAVDIATGLARIRDVETGAHLERMAAYSRLIAVALADGLDLSDEFIEYLYLFAPLHDIGKVGIPDRILLKPGKLDDEERRCMQQHVAVGVQLARNIIGDLGIDNDLAATVMLNVVAHHHERGDGSGYPQGLKMADIPIEARIVAVADVYDAISSARPYKPAWSEAECVAELRREAALKRLETIRAHGAVKMGLIKDPEEAASRQHTPKLAWVAGPKEPETSGRS